MLALNTHSVRRAALKQLYDVGISYQQFVFRSYTQIASTFGSKGAANAKHSVASKKMWTERFALANSARKRFEDTHNFKAYKNETAVKKRRSLSGKPRAQNLQQFEFESEEELGASQSSSHHDIIESEIRAHRARVHFTLERKLGYRAPSEDNMLTWTAKQQIRELHSAEPDVWTPEKIAQGFPISVEGARRLLRGKFTQKCPTRIAEHDERVRQRWEALERGETDGVLSDYTLRLFAEGKIKYLPMYNYATIASDLRVMDGESDSEKPALPLPRSFSAMLNSYKAMKLHEQQDGITANPNNKSSFMRQASKAAVVPRRQFTLKESA